jgi:glycosyltransferase involved in cell wall biosynthesis
MPGAVSVVYAIGSTFGATGIGTTAHHGVCGLHAHGMLKRLVCGACRSADIPASLVRSFGPVDQVLRRLAFYRGVGLMTHLQDVVFDSWAARQLEPADLFCVWANDGLRALRRAKRLGMVCVTEYGGFHPRHQRQVLADEHARWGVRFRRPMAMLRRSLAEIALADYVLCQTDFARRTFVENGVPERQVLTVTNGVDLTRFHPAARAGQRPFRVLFVGQLGLRKGVLYLLEAWRQLGWRDAELWLAGRADPEFRPLLRPFTSLPGLRVLGHVGDPLALYHAADVFAFPSLVEGSAKVNFEAMACGLPAVTTPTAGSEIQDGVDGVLVPPRSVAELAAALDGLRGDPQRCREMGVAARRRAQAFSWQRHAEALAETFTTIGRRERP